MGCWKNTENQPNHERHSMQKMTRKKILKNVFEKLTPKRTGIAESLISKDGWIFSIMVIQFLRRKDFTEF